MRILFAVSTLLLIAGCSSTRVLPEAERARHGLSGVMYDARLCPTVRDERTGLLRENGKCELVTCEPERGKIVCRAKPEPSRRR